MELSIDGFNNLKTIEGILIQALEKFAPQEITETGIKVADLLETIRKNGPDKIPLRATGPLSSGVAVPMNDFDLAHYLVLVDDPAMQDVIKAAKTVPVLMAYAATLATKPELLDSDLLKSMLKYAVTSLQNKEEAARLTNQALLPILDQLKPLATIGQHLKETNTIKGAAFAKLTMQQKQRIAAEYARRVSSGEKYGAAKNLAGLYSVSTTTIHNIVKKTNADSIDK